MITCNWLNWLFLLIQVSLAFESVADKEEQIQSEFQESSALKHTEPASNDVLVLDTPIDYKFEEKLDLTPLPNNFLLASFQFWLQSEKFKVGVDGHDSDEYSHHTVFPKSIGPLMSQTNTRQLRLRFTRGRWDSQDWGQLPHKGAKSGGTGVELWTVIEAGSKEEAFKSWTALTNSLSGLFCASINFIDSSKTTFPLSAFLPDNGDEIPLFHSDNQLYLLRAALANEPICTENLTPFVRLLPMRGKSGISSLLDGHKIFDSNWHSMSIDVDTVCDSSTDECFYKMEEFVETVINVPNSLARADRPIPKPLPGDELRCDTNKPYDPYQCFPLPENKEVKFDLSKLFGRKIRGGTSLSLINSQVCVYTPDNWEILVQVGDSFYSTDDNCFDLVNSELHDVHFESSDSQNVLALNPTPLYVSRALTGYGQDKGGLRSVFHNPSNKTVEFVYFESLPWFMRIYLSSLAIESDDPELTLEMVIKSTFYSPAKDRERPTHLERVMSIPPNCTFALTLQFDKSLLKYAEYPPDANHGFEIEAGVVTVKDPQLYQTRTSSLLLYLSTPDFSMPYNVIILSSTVMGLAFGTLFNLISKRLITVEEADRIVALNSRKTRLLKLRSKVLELFKAKNKAISSGIKTE